MGKVKNINIIFLDLWQPFIIIYEVVHIKHSVSNVELNECVVLFFWVFFGLKMICFQAGEWFYRHPLH